MNDNTMYVYIWTALAVVSLAITAAIWDATRYESYNQTLRSYVGRAVPADWSKP